jgi:hypothetical protein
MSASRTPSADILASSSSCFFRVTPKFIFT